ncbi:hypothetical protein Tsubulata_027310, partial [Turnera subulata]
HFHTSLSPQSLHPSTLQSTKSIKFLHHAILVHLFLPTLYRRQACHLLPTKLLPNLPGIHASYALFSATTGQTLASTDGTVLTLYRTSCSSGLASKILAREDSQVHVMVDAGALAPHLIKAHLAARPSLREVTIWNRTLKKAEDLVEKLRKECVGVCFESNEKLEDWRKLMNWVDLTTEPTVYTDFQ